MLWHESAISTGPKMGPVLFPMCGTRFSSNMCRWSYLGIHIPNAPYFGLQTPNLGDEKAFPEWTQELVVLQLHPLKRTLGGQETMLMVASGKLGMVPLSNMKLPSGNLT